MECSEAQPFMDESLACGCKKQCQALLLLLLHTSWSTTIDTYTSSITSITLLLNYSTTSTTVTTTTTNF